MIYSYPKIYNLGHKALLDLFQDEVVIEAKIDGSQFSFGILDGKLCCRSRGREIDLNYPDKMFSTAIARIKQIKDKLKPGLIYRGEYLMRPKHNALAYNRVPVNNIIIFDIVVPIENYYSYEEKKREAERLGFECVPLIYKGMVSNLDELKKYLDVDDVLGGQKIEGIVIKNYNRFGADKKVLMGKLVSDNFKEKNKTEWKKNHPTQKDFVQQIIMSLKTEARWKKAIQHLKENGEISGIPKDIGKIIQEIHKDIIEEESDYIKELLFQKNIKHICKCVSSGFPEFYKKILNEKQFKGDLA